MWTLVCGKNKAESHIQPLTLFRTHSWTHAHTAEACTLCRALWGACCHFLFPILCHIECFICRGRLICLDLGLWLQASVYCQCLSSSSRALFCFFSSILFPSSSTIGEDSTIKALGFISDFFPPATELQLVFHSKSLSFFPQSSWFHFQTFIVFHPCMPWLWYV